SSVVEHLTADQEVSGSNPDKWCSCFFVSQPGRKLPRFPAASECLSDVEPDTRELVRAQNKKKKKSGGFQSMGRLFEMGFAEQLQEIIRRLPDTRQTLLFSATLPKLLVEFARAGLTEPVLIRLDVDSKLSDQIKLSFFHLRVDDKPALLLHLLRNVVKPQEQTVVFAATKHHVEYLKELLSSEGLECAYIYSALDQTARKINIGKFVHRKAMVLLVTDVAARGIDIPLLDNVINYNFPSKAKLFLHRVGRVGRAGRSGTAYSLICPDEMPYVYDLHLFLGRPVQFASPEHTEEGVFGRVPQRILDDESAHLITSHENFAGPAKSAPCLRERLQAVPQVAAKPSPESIRRVKNVDLSSMGVHPVLGCGLEKMELECLQIVDAIKSYKSKAVNHLEINSSSKTPASEVMRAKRSKDTGLVDKFSKQREDRAAESRLQQPINPTTTADCDITEKEESDLNVSMGEVLNGLHELLAEIQRFLQHLYF
uniref:Helicase C-terminal domain-containing protein n=1 Tax=Oreochromis aureus TaxID=47969 RepID=A0AAZ1WYX5_OREAU